MEYSQQLNNGKATGDLTKLEQSLNQNNSKFQVLINQKNQNQSSNQNTLNLTISAPLELSEQQFYIKERNARPIYQDEDLHVMMLSLILCLLLKPERGILDDLYCSQYPIDNGKQNILFLLHHHLNHNENQPVIGKIL